MADARIYKLRAIKSDLGDLSDEFETINGQPGAISSGKHDPGGKSYGIHQFTSQDVDKHGHIVHNGGTVTRFLDSKDGEPWRDEFKDAKGHELKAATPQFDKKWREVAEKDGDSFAAAQYNFTCKNYYDPQAGRLAGAGVDLQTRSEALGSVVLSTSVQHGANSDLMVHALENKAKGLHKSASKLTDDECIDAIYDRRIKEFPSCKNRYEAERTEAKNMLRREREQSAETPQAGMPQGGHQLAPVPPQLSDDYQRPPVAGNVLPAANDMSSGLVPVPEALVQAALQQADPTQKKQDNAQEGASQAQDTAEEKQDKPGGKKDKIRQRHDTVSDWNSSVTPRSGGF